MAQRIRSLDGVRGVAILFVVAAHVAPRYFHQGGVVGVTLFFVLSGYLISSVLFSEASRTGSIDWVAFYIRRALRLVPALVVMLAALPLVLWAVGDPRLEGYGVDAVLALFYVGDFAQAAGDAMGLLSHTWSLAVEEQFYLLWPLVIGLVAVRRTGNALLLAIASLAVVAVGWRLLASAALDFDRVYYAPDTNAFALLLGCTLAAYDRNRGTRGRGSTGLAVAGVSAMVVLAIVPEGGITDELVTVGAVAAGLAGLCVVAASRGRDLPLLTFPVLTWFGKISYALYLWHVPLVFLEINGRPLGNAGRVVMAGVAVGVAWLSWVVVESRALQLKARFERTPSPAAR